MASAQVLAQNPPKGMGVEKGLKTWFVNPGMEFFGPQDQTRSELLIFTSKPVLFTVKNNNIRQIRG